MQEVFAIDASGPAIFETVSLAPIDLDLLAIIDSIPELTSWLSAGDAVIATPGTAASFQWRDRKNGIVGVPTQAGFPPTIAAVNGLPAIKGAGAGVAYAGRSLFNAAAYTRLVVVQPAVVNGHQAIFGSKTGAGPRLTAYHNPDGQIYLDNNPSTTAVPAQASAAGFMPRGVTTMLAVSWSAAAAKFTIRKGGATIATITSAESPGDPGASTIIGAAIDNLTDGFAGFLFEVLEFAGVDMLATAAGLESLGLIEDSFRAKYGTV